MTKYNKLSSLILFSLVSQLGHTLSFDSANVQSGQGQLLYVEIPYRNANNNQDLQVNLASGEDLMQVGATPPSDNNLNIFVRRTSANSGVIVVTSDRPITTNQINVALKVQDGDGTYIQQVKKALPAQISKTTVATSTKEKALVPQVVTEKDIALNLPTSTLYNTAKPAMSPSAVSASSSITSADQPLAIQVSPPPALKPVQPPKTSVATAVSQKTEIQIAHSAPSAQQTTPPMNSVSAARTTSPSKSEPQKEHTAKVQPKIKQPSKTQPATDTATRYTVQHQDSLWAIASRIAAETHQPIPTVMKEIKMLNEHAFIAGNINRLKQGASLNLNVNQKPSQAKAISHQTPSTTAKTKYRLDQAEMSLIADNPHQISSDVTQQAKQHPVSNALSGKLRTTRQQTLALQKQVSQLDFALQQKDHKLQLLNARLAQLQQQLQQRQAAKKQQHH